MLDVLVKDLPNNVILFLILTVASVQRSTPYDTWLTVRARVIVLTNSANASDTKKAIYISIIWTDSK